MRNQLILLIQEREAARITFWEKKHRLETLMAEVPSEDRDIVSSINRLFLKRIETVPDPKEPEEPIIQKEEEKEKPSVPVAPPVASAPKQKTEAQKAAAKRKRERMKEKEQAKKARSSSPGPSSENWQDQEEGEELGKEEDQPENPI
jgi:hypothetical protein